MSTRIVPSVRPSDTELEALASALGRELELVRELRQALRDQRAGIASHHTAAVEDSLQRVGHLLMALEERRRARAQLLETMAGTSNSSLAWIDDLPAPPAALGVVRHELRTAAREVAHEVAVNHEVLRRSVEAGDAFLQALFSSVRGIDPCYRPEAAPPEPATGVIMNRRA